MNEIERINSIPSDPEFYEFPRETWDEKKCQKISKQRGTDPFGNKHPYPGLICEHSDPYFHYGERGYNGGCSHDGEWYKGEIRRFPIIPDSFEIYSITTWGFYIRKKNTTS